MTTDGKRVTREGLARALKTYGVTLETNALEALWHALPADPPAPQTEEPLEIRHDDGRVWTLTGYTEHPSATGDPLGATYPGQSEDER